MKFLVRNRYEFDNTSFDGVAGLPKAFPDLDDGDFIKPVLEILAVLLIKATRQHHSDL